MWIIFSHKHTFFVFLFLGCQMFSLRRGSWRRIRSLRWRSNFSWIGFRFVKCIWPLTSCRKLISSIQMSTKRSSFLGRQESNGEKSLFVWLTNPGRWIGATCLLVISSFLTTCNRKLAPILSRVQTKIVRIENEHTDQYHDHHHGQTSRVKYYKGSLCMTDI